MRIHFFLLVPCPALSDLGEAGGQRGEREAIVAPCSLQDVISDTLGGGPGWNWPQNARHKRVQFGVEVWRRKKDIYWQINAFYVK